MPEVINGQGKRFRDSDKPPHIGEASIKPSFCGNVLSILGHHDLGSIANCQKLLTCKVSDLGIAISHLILGKQASNRYSVEMPYLSWAIKALVLLMYLHGHDPMSFANLYTLVDQRLRIWMIATIDS